MFWFIVCFFKQKTAYEMRISDWSSDVCSSDLRRAHLGGGGTDLIERRMLAADQPVIRGGHISHGARCGVDLPGDSPNLGDQRLQFVEKTVEIGRASCRERVCQYV